MTISATINPIRWKGFYYDEESGYYYANGRYYDPETGTYLDASDATSIVDNAYTPLGLDRNGILCNNVHEFVRSLYAIFTVLEMSPDGDYDPNENKPWWEIAWNAVVNSFVTAINNISKWLNENKWISWVVAGLQLAVGIILCFIPGAQGLGVALLISGASSMISNTISAMGIDGKTACIITSLLDVIGGIALCFTPFAGLGAGLIGSGIGGIAGGYISEAVGGSFELGSIIGSIAGSIIGGKIHDAYKFSKIAKQGIVIGKSGSYDAYAKAHNLAYYEGLPGHKFIKKFFS